VGLSPDTAFLGRTTNGRLAITALAMATGRPAWTKPLDDPGPVLPMLFNGVLLMRLGQREVHRKTPGGEQVLTFYQSTVAWDGATGTELWRAPGGPALQTSDEVLLESNDEQGRTDRLTLVRLRDGTPIWSHGVAGTRAWTWIERDGRAVELVTADNDNTVTRYRFADGSVAGRGRLRADAGDLGAVGGYLTTTRAAVTTVYRPDDLVPLWSMDTTNLILSACGPVICRSGSGAAAGLDPATGRQVWRRSFDMYPRPTLGRLVLLSGDLSSETKVVDVLTGRAEDDGPVYLVLDPATGRSVIGPDRGEVLWQNEAADSVLVFRPPISRPGRTLITRVDLSTGRSSLLGTTAEVLGSDCATLPRYVVCQDTDRLSVMAVG
jgi:outer membrane protein assembly factor BamB